MSFNPEPHFVSMTLLQQAEQMCQRRLSADPDNQPLLASLAQIQRKQGRLDEAAALYARMSLLDPDDRQAAYMHALLAGTDVPVLPAGLRPAPFVLLDNFLPPSFHEMLLPFVLSVQDKLVPAKVAINGEKTDKKDGYDPEARESLDLPGEWEVKRRFRECVRDIIPTVMSRLHVVPFEIGQLEVKVRAYLDGHFFRLHMDCPPGNEVIALRTISYVYFFHAVPRGYTGGDLLLFDSDVDTSQCTTSRFTRIVPHDNRLVLFPSAYYHSVVPIRCPSQRYEDSRFVINGHISRVAAKPAVENAPIESVSVSGCAEIGA